MDADQALADLVDRMLLRRARDRDRAGRNGAADKADTGGARCDREPVGGPSGVGPGRDSVPRRTWAARTHRGTSRPGPPCRSPPSPLQGRRAGLVTRALADSVDFAVVAGVLGLATWGSRRRCFIWRSRTFTFPTPSFLLVLVLGGILSVLYLTATWGTTGRSYGKHVLGLRVVGPFGRLRVAGAFLRAVLCVIFPVGLVWVLVRGTTVPFRTSSCGRRSSTSARRAERARSCRGAGVRSAAWRDRAVIRQGGTKRRHDRRSMPT